MEPVKLEYTLRECLIKLHTLSPNLDTLTDDATFKVMLHTTEYASVEFGETAAFEVSDESPLWSGLSFCDSFQEFPWIQISQKSSEIASSEITPIHCVDTEAIKLQLYLEKRSKAP